MRCMRSTTAPMQQLRPLPCPRSSTAVPLNPLPRLPPPCRAGWGNLGGRTCAGANAANMDTTRSFGWAAAAALGADAQVLAWSGAGLLTYTKR